MTGNGNFQITPVGWRYRWMAAMLTPFALAVSARLALRHRQWRYLAERLGWCHSDTPHRPLWFHAASVGEVLALVPLIRTLRARDPARPVLVTTVTPTGAEIVARQLAGIASHQYLPWDTPRAVRRFLDKTRPCCTVIMETELWPTLYAECACRGIPPLIINGRISARTQRPRRWLRDAYRSALANCCAVLARSQADADGFLALGAAAGKVSVVGNIKLAPPVNTAAGAGNPALHSSYVLAASTHEDEEQRLASLWLAQPKSEHLLVIAPRHPQRGPAIAAQLRQLTSAIAVRSQGDRIESTTRIYLADTLGEMQWLMGHAKLVVMGGSFITHGGHNVLEPAHLGKAIITGPHMDNFSEETALLAGAGALHQVRGYSELETTLAELLGNAARRAELELAARHVLAPFSSILETYEDAVAAHCRCLKTR